MVLKVGLTGGIGSGKSIVAKIFSILGIPVFYADVAAKLVMQEDAVLKQKIKEIFGNAAYENDLLNRKYIADIVFNNPFKLEQLNALVHPATIAMAENWLRQQTTPYVIKEAALLFEAGTTAGLDFITGVYAPHHLRLQRVMQRDNATREEVLARMSKQINEEMKMRLCNFVIVNDEQQPVIPQVLQLHNKLLNLAESK